MGHRKMPAFDSLQGFERPFADVFASVLARRRTEQESAGVREQLAHIDRLTAMGKVSASIAHEMNQPLCAIVSNAQAAARLLTKTPIDVGEIGGALSDIIDAANRASAVISRMRGFLQRKAPQRTRLDVNVIIHEVLALLRAEMGRRRTRITVKLAESLPPILADAVQLQQVMVNLLINGAEAMDDLTPELRELEIQSILEGGAWIAVEVMDRGRGLDPAARPRLFGPFFTTKPDGLGMGLAICKSIVEAHGGRISAQARTGGGMRMQFALPIIQRRTKALDALDTRQSRSLPCARSGTG
jgi:C4-dicarboxylate-specific signal transduction histidine kinase